MRIQYYKFKYRSSKIEHSAEVITASNQSHYEVTDKKFSIFIFFILLDSADSTGGIPAVTVMGVRQVFPDLPGYFRCFPCKSWYLPRSWNIRWVIRFFVIYYHPPTKLWEGIMFSVVPVRQLLCQKRCPTAQGPVRVPLYRVMDLVQDPSPTPGLFIMKHVLSARRVVQTLLECCHV